MGQKQTLDERLKTLKEGRSLITTNPFKAEINVKLFMKFGKIQKCV